MEPYYMHYYSFLKEHSLNLKYSSHLITLYTVYTSLHPIHSDQIQALFDTTEDVLRTLSTKRRHKLFRLILEICTAYEQQAFIEGIRVGTQLENELLNRTE